MIRKFLLGFIFPVFYSAIHAQQPAEDYFEWGRQMEIMASVMKQILNNYVETPNPEKMGTDAIKGMLSGTDRYTRFYDEQQMFEQRLRQSGKISGIGIRIRNHDDGLQIRDVMPGTPARKAGLLPGDIIIAIDGQDLKELTSQQKDKLITGKPGSTVKLKIRRGQKTFELEATRQIIDQKAVPYYGLLPGKTGYIHLRKFTRTAATEVQEALVDLKNQGAERIVLDLRDNPGGLLSQAIGTVNLFIPKGKLVVETRGRITKFNRQYHTKHSPIDENIPLFIWINGHSASASEIVSGALQDYDRAVIVGDTSFGKGLVQRYFPVKYGTYVKITISKYYLPSGRLIQKVDYWHRDNKGHTTRYARGDKEFHTQSGRKVYEHGGIAPDRYVPSDTLLTVVKGLTKDDRFFPYFVDYIRHQSAPASPGDLDENRLAAGFEKYLKKEHIELSAPWTKYLEKALKSARKNKAAKDQIRSLENTLEQQRQALWNELTSPAGRRQTGILIKRMLIGYYFGPGELSRYDVQHTPLIRFVR